MTAGGSAARLLGVGIVLILVGSGAVHAAGEGKASMHLGPRTCWLSECHRSAAPRQGGEVRLTEYEVRRHDRHARSYETLRGDRSRRIAENLGLGAAESEPSCLACHADAVPESRQGPDFDVTDGVGCEACHGAAKAWFKSHRRRGATHAENVDRGMRPLDDPRVRAELCLNCHFGAPGRMVTHRLLAAGHPRLAFELATYSRNQPAHYVVDADYRARKQAPSDVQTWALGQVVAMQRLLDVLVASGGHGGRQWGEIALLECRSCHRPIGARPIANAGAAGPRLGLPRLNDAPMVMLSALFDGLDAGTEQLLRADRTMLLRQVGPLGPRAAGAEQMREGVPATAARLATWSPDAAAQRRLLDALLAVGVRDDAYGVAEQQAMAIEAVARTAGTGNALDARCAAGLDAGLDALVRATSPGYDVAGFRLAIDRLRRLGCGE